MRVHSLIFRGPYNKMTCSFSCAVHQSSGFQGQHGVKKSLRTPLLTDESELLLEGVHQNVAYWTNVFFFIRPNHYLRWFNSPTSQNLGKMKHLENVDDLFESLLQPNHGQPRNAFSILTNGFKKTWLLSCCSKQITEANFTEIQESDATEKDQQIIALFTEDLQKLHQAPSFLSFSQERIGSLVETNQLQLLLAYDGICN